MVKIKLKPDFHYNVKEVFDFNEKDENKPGFSILVKIKINRVFTTVCQRSSDPFYIVGYYMKWVTTSLTYSMFEQKSEEEGVEDREDLDDSARAESIVRDLIFFIILIKT